MLDVGTLVLTGTYIVTAEIAMLHRLPLFSESQKASRKKPVITCTWIFTQCNSFLWPACPIYPHILQRKQPKTWMYTMPNCDIQLYVVVKMQILYPWNASNNSLCNPPSLIFITVYMLDIFLCEEKSNHQYVTTWSWKTFLTFTFSFIAYFNFK